jgi:hypothetical protein
MARERWICKNIATNLPDKKGGGNIGRYVFFSRKCNLPGTPPIKKL